jgi:hypothetical protein
VLAFDLFVQEERSMTVDGAADDIRVRKVEGIGEKKRLKYG